MIGAVSGSFGGNLISDYLRKRSERENIRKNIINTYLIQLQDAIESLWFRFYNIKDRGGRLVMSDKYYEHSTLYALASVLAYNRIMLLDGIYSQLRQLVPNLDILKQNLSKLEHAMDTSSLASLYKYDRLSLAEAVLEIEKERLRVCSYLNFKEKYENNANVKTSLVPAKSFVEALEGPGIELIMLRLKEIAQMLPQATGIASTVK